MLFSDRVDKVKTSHSYYLLIKKELEPGERENLQRLIAELSDGYNPDAFPYVLLSVLFSIPFVIVFEYILKGIGVTMTTTVSFVMFGVAVLVGKQFAWKVRGNVKASYLGRQEKRMSE